MKKKAVVLNKKRNVTLTPYIVSKKNTPCILILPGGAYRNCELSEGEPVARAFNERGFNCFILCYSVGDKYKWPYPLDDYEQAVEYIKENSEKYHVDTEHLVVMGFSAGGHLASAAATIARNKPFACALCYALTNEKTLVFSQATDAPDTSKLVDMNTSPCFIASSRNDWIVPSFNTSTFIDALEKNYIDYEAHIYGYSMHGFSVGKEAGADTAMFCSRVGDWVDEFVSWLDELISGRYVSIRESAEYNDTFSDKLSTANSCAVIFKDEHLRKRFRNKFPIYYLIYKMLEKKLPDFTRTITLRNIYQLLKINPDKIKQMDLFFENYHENR